MLQLYWVIRNHSDQLDADSADAICTTLALKQDTVVCLGPNNLCLIYFTMQIEFYHTYLLAEKK